MRKNKHMRLFRKSSISRSRRASSRGYDVMLREGAGCGDFPRVEQAIRDGASINSFGALTGDTALLSAASGGQLRICRLLLKLGASSDRANNLGKTPLMAAAEGGHYDICRLLLSRKADPLKEGYHDCTALHYAAGNGHTDICILLVENGADVNAKTDKQQKPFQIAYNAGKLQTGRLLRSIQWVAEMTEKKTARAFLNLFFECAAI